MVIDFYKSIGIPPGTILDRNNKVKYNKFVFDTIFKPRIKHCELNGFVVELDSKDKKIIDCFVKKKVKKKRGEFDNSKNQFLEKRESTGACIEYGILKFFGKDSLFDDSIVDSSHKRNYPDLLPMGIVCDIKGSSLNHVPLIFKSTRLYECKRPRYAGSKYRCSNILGITDTKKVWILGVASPEILNKYVDDNLFIMSENSTKTGFYGVNKLIDSPKEWNELKALCSNLNLKL